MKFIRFLVFSLFFVPMASFGASNDFMLAAQLLAAAKSADIQQVQALVNNGANVNFVDSTGVSIVCTALMNNDVRAAQILQMYGADASSCDRQIKQYKNRTRPKENGGMFSGLSSAQTISLAAAGAAVVVGGLFLLTDVFDPGNDNDSAGGSGDRPSNNPNGGGDSNGPAVEAFAKLPYGPACDVKTGVCGNVDDWSPNDDSVRAWDFEYMSDFNYLMMAYAYNAFARGYLGMDTIRITNDKTPFDLSGLPFTGAVPGGERPVTVATITANGVNPTGSLGDGLLEWADENEIAVAQSACTQYGANSPQCTNAMVQLVQFSRKFYNRESTTDLTDLAERSGFDFSGHGTVFGSATTTETLMGKVIAGWEAGGRATGDAYGFVPNGQLAVYRTGGGLAVDATVGTVENANLLGEWSNGDTFTVNGVTYKLAIAENGSIVATNVANDMDILQLTKQGTTLTWNQGDIQYEALFGGSVNSLKPIDYKNYDAMLNALTLRHVGGDAVVSVLANIEQNPNSSNSTYLNMRDFKSIVSVATTDAQRRTAYANYINKYYNQDVTNDATVGSVGEVADAVYKLLGNNQTAILVNSVGAYKYGIGDGMSVAVLDPTFENYAPALYPDMEHLFMSVVAVSNQKGTGGVNDVSDYTGNSTATGKLVLSQWGTDYNELTQQYDNAYVSRKCGDAGVGLNGVDPWCFAAPGLNSEMAVSSMAGAVASVQSAFSYLSNQEVFALIALTADGAYLGTNPASGKSWADTAELVGYLKGRYVLPGEYSPETDEEYLAAFKDVYGYGMVNLERATRPGSTVYYYNGKNIVSADGNAYWRTAVNTVFKPSSVLNMRGSTIRAPFYDVLESADGEMSMPRVWENEFAFGAGDRRGLYMGDVLGELTTRRDTSNRSQFGSFGLSMKLGERAYVDNMNGLDNLSLDYTSGAWNFGASYQRYFTDGVSRFSGLANPVLGLASDVIVSDVSYGVGNWAFGVRAFSGAITDEGLLENDPTVSAQYLPARLGLMRGAQSHVAWNSDTFSLVATVGNANETDTLLGAMSDGLLDFGAGDTLYFDAFAKYQVSDLIDLTARATFARTKTNASGDFILGLTDIDSNAFAFGANVGNFEFSVSQPLAITDGSVRYAYADYNVYDGADGKYELDVTDAHIAKLDLSASQREVRFTGTYRHRFGQFTDGALGFIYRVNPNHTDDFGNESIFMMKLSHRLGI